MTAPMTFSQWWWDNIGGREEKGKRIPWGWVDGFNRLDAHDLWKAAQHALLQELARGDSDNA